MKNGLTWLKKWKYDIVALTAYCILIPVTVLGCYFLLEYPSFLTVGKEYWQELFLPKYTILNLMTVGVLWCVLFAICNRIWLTNLLFSSACGIIAIINYYVITLHGMPLSFLLLKNLKTALNVMDGYTITLDLPVIKMLSCMAILILLSIVAKLLAKKRRWHAKLPLTLAADVLILAMCVLFFHWGYIGENPVKPAKTIGWRWMEPYCQYGYLGCTIETLFQSLSAVNEPEGFSQEALDKITISSSENTQTETPDVILILNESFFDLRQINDITTDVPYLSNIESMDNLLSGYAVVPSVGGGTNYSEYELLTSNSMNLMPGVTPFNVLDLSGANSITSHFNTLGYYTLGSHSESGVNYSRVTAYKNLQFKSVHFEEDYTDLSYYHDRLHKMDEGLYRNLTRWYGDNSDGTPQFLYLLTIQNHAGYEQNDSQYDTVHVLGDWGEYTQTINEYLTCISLSDQAFLQLTSYFSQQERPVIICMLGDHMPSFAKNLISDDYSKEEADLRSRSVPLLIWANFSLEQQDLGTMSMNYVVPTLLDIAGVPLTPYYSYMLQLKEQVPILTAYGDYYDAQGNRYTYDSDEGAPYQQAVDNYFYLEYENLQKNRNQSLFEPYTK